MTTITVYRYDDQNIEVGETVVSRGDHSDRLTAIEKTVEAAIRAALPDGEKIRATSLYTWQDEKFARRVWLYSGKRYLYEIEVDEADVRFTGDLNHFSDAKDAAQASRPISDSVAAYCTGAPLRPEHTRPRVEILVARGKVVKKLLSK